ncbi:uncharacterized protein LOC111087437 [Limulus polyphemus]|uniref:Uncharacterized protein LOC111087437 n=1 Tax=Limulus polyphemus TaxID=6850 RepID=A0ABM1T1L4_LIMPO|nr:uncharacterized protein LOC111087437 [Limulus polyphemus]
MMLNPFSATFYLLLTVVVIGETGQVADKVTPEVGDQADMRNGQSKSLLESLRIIQNLHEDVKDDRNTDIWKAFTPPPVVDPECHVKIEVCKTKRIPGRCTNLGGTVPACQTQNLLSLNEFTQCGQDFVV